MQNGRQNRVVFSVSQPAGTDQALTLESITGAFLDPNRPDGHRRRVLRNMTTASLKNRPTIRQTGGQPLQIPFDFYSEFKPEKYDVEFRMNVYDQTASKSFNVQAYRGSVTVEEPPFDWFDYQLLSIYALLLACACGAPYWAYTTYISPSNRKSRPAQKRTDTATKPTQAKAPAAEASGSKESASNKTYDEEWIVRILFANHLHLSRSTSCGRASRVRTSKCRAIITQIVHA